MGPLALILATALAVGAEPGGGEPAVIPVRQRTLLALRVLVYDRNLAARAPGDVVVAVLFRPGDAASERERDEVQGALSRLGDEVVAKGRTIRGVAVPVTSAPDLSQRLAALGPAAAWVCDALAPQAAELARVTAARKVLSMTGSRTAVEAGLAIGVVPGPRRAVILVNPAAAKAEGADLDAALLGVAEIVEGKR
jgi:hypothetical protein